MANPLNLYATKVFAEHPIALWALDEQVDYRSLIDSSPQTFDEEKDQNLSTWTVSGAEIVDARITSPFLGAGGVSNLRKEKFTDVPINGIKGVEGNSNFISFVSSVSINPEDIDPTLGTISMGAYFYLFSLPISEESPDPLRVSFGLTYQDPTTLETRTSLKNANLVTTGSWEFVSETFILPQSFTDLRITFEIFYVGNEEYNFAINGISLGQWAEEFSVESLGVVPETLPVQNGKIIPVNSLGLPALSYGISDKTAYYLSDGKKMVAKNAGLPLVYGAFNSTEIIPNGNNPSLIVPGLGFLNEVGQYRNLTLEFWAKIRTSSNQPRRIVGPIGSSDGIYVEGPFVKVKVGKYSGSHFVGEWERPMLFDLRLTYSSATLILNGEEVIDIDVDARSLNYPEFETDTDSLDWIGFYAYEDVPSIQLDAVGIYAYEVPAIVAKRRWVYGQAVEVPDNIQGLNPSNTVFLDYSFSNYTKNHSYPKIGSWQNGVSDNLRIEDLFIASPQYEKPKLYFNNKTEEQWSQDSRIGEESNNLSIRLRPSGAWLNTFGYILFPRLNFLREEVKAFYGVFKIPSSPEGKETIFELVNELSGSSIEAYLLDDEIRYDFSYLDVSGSLQIENMYAIENQSAGHEALVGIDIDKVIRFFGNRMALFFGNKQNLKLYVGGKKDFSNVFTGEILRFGFSTALNLQKIQSAFNNLGFIVDPFTEYLDGEILDSGDEYFGNETSFWSVTLDGGSVQTFSDSYTINTHVSSYTLVPKINLGVFVLDIACSSYWEDYMPLSYFAKYIKNVSGDSRFDLDLMQFNFDYPKMNLFFGDRYDTRESLVRTYVSFQPLSYGANLTREYSVEIEYLSKSGIVQPGSDWVDHSSRTIKKYEVLNDSIIYTPAGIDLGSVGIFFHVEIESPGIETSPIKIRSLQIASKALNEFPNAIGTRFGADLVPYRKFGVYKDYKAFNPLTVTKNSSPYLYLSSTSGMRMRGDYSISSARYVEQRINPNATGFYKVGAIQLAARYEEQSFPLTPVEIFEIETPQDIIKFYLIADNLSGNRGQIYAIDTKTGTFKSGIVFYMDGKVVKRLIVKPDTWSVWGLSFEEALDFSGNDGAIRITSPIRFDNISHYQVTAEDEIKQNSFRKWSAVAANEFGPIDWDYWANTETEVPDPNNPGEFLREFQWFDVLFFGEERTISTLDAADIYKKFAGTSRFIVDSDRVLRLGDYRYTTYKDLSWSRIVVDAV
jgi:hypothetical protein